jgi:hypothetical protein
MEIENRENTQKEIMKQRRLLQMGELWVMECLDEMKIDSGVAYCMAKPQGLFKTRALFHQIYLTNGHTHNIYEGLWAGWSPLEDCFWVVFK